MFLEAGRVPQNHVCCFYLRSRPPEPCLLFSSWSLSPPKPRLLLSFSVKTRKTRSAAFTFSQDPRDHVCCFDFGSRPPERRRVFVFFVWLGSVFFFVWLGSVGASGGLFFFSSSGLARCFCSSGLARWGLGKGRRILFFSCLGSVFSSSGLAQWGLGELFVFLNVWRGSVFFFVWLGSVGLGEGRKCF